jgi:hypothetical protein
MSRGLGYTKGSPSQRGKLSVSEDEWLEYSEIYGGAELYGALGDYECVSMVQVFQGWRRRPYDSGGCAVWEDAYHLVIS